ncbi:DUF885 domain-containing protein [Litorimonas sp. WD9-15]|uniref:DUF885 domain-containing protein n=1 Tax=Litorimonas sp. WD9-15 TaxID=3418716 RepID=UPI003D062D39
MNILPTKRLLLATSFTAILALTACQPATDAPTPKSQQMETVQTASTDEDENAKLDAWFEARFIEGIRAYPEFMTSLGMDERQDEWNDPSRAFDLEQLDKARANLAEMKEMFDFDDLDASHQLSYRLFEKDIEDDIIGKKWWDHGYVYTQMRGVHSAAPTFLMNQHKINDIEDAQNYVARLEKLGAYLDAHTQMAKDRFENGVFPPRFVYDFVIESSKNVMSGAPMDGEEAEMNLLLNDFKNKADKVEMDDEARAALYERAITAVQNGVVPAYQRIVTEMERQKPLASTDDGAWKLPDGDAYYAWRLKEMTTIDMSAEEIHDLGLAEVDRIHAEMREIMKTVEYDGTLQEFFEFTRTDKQFFKPEGKRGQAAYLREATEFIDNMKVRLPEVFNRLPKAELDVRAVEPFREKAAGKAFYNRPAPDGSRPGIYYANLYRMDAMPVYQMEALAYHEGVPGHHMQIAIAQELEGIPSFRKYGRYTAYSEGWGLYSEYLPKEMGLYEDPYSDFGRLAMELWRAARLVVDTGLHDKKWTREEAIEYLMVNTPNPESDAVKAIERYIVMPGQATAYKIGMNKILDLRENAKEELGDDFDIRDFHDAILATGAVPLDIMEEQVEAYIEDMKSGTYEPDRL